MTSGHSHMKLAQLCEDKGEACAGHRPSTSIWVLSSLGPGGTWDHTSRGGPAGIYCPLMVCAVQCRIHEARLHYMSAALAHLLHRLWSSHISSSETATQRWSAAPSEPLTRDTFCVVTLSVKQKNEKQLWRCVKSLFCQMTTPEMYSTSSHLLTVLDTRLLMISSHTARAWAAAPGR